MGAAMGDPTGEADTSGLGLDFANYREYGGEVGADAIQVETAFAT